MDALPDSEIEHDCLRYVLASLMYGESCEPRIAGNSIGNDDGLFQEG